VLAARRNDSSMFYQVVPSVLPAILSIANSQALSNPRTRLVRGLEDRFEIVIEHRQRIRVGRYANCVAPAVSEKVWAERL